MTDADTAKVTAKVWDAMHAISICMLTTWNGSISRARPMGAFFRDEDHTISFLTDARGIKDDEIARFPQVSLTFVDNGAQKYVALSGLGEISNDRAKIRELWSTPAKAWWDSPDDPNIRVLKVTPEQAEYWEGPGKISSYVKMALAAAVGRRPDMGDHKKIAIT